MAALLLLLLSACGADGGGGVNVGTHLDLPAASDPEPGATDATGTTDGEARHWQVQLQLDTDRDAKGAPPSGADNPMGTHGVLQIDTARLQAPLLLLAAADESQTGPLASLTPTTWWSDLDFDLLAPTPVSAEVPPQPLAIELVLAAIEHESLGLQLDGTYVRAMREQRVELRLASRRSVHLPVPAALTGGRLLAELSEQGLLERIDPLLHPCVEALLPDPAPQQEAGGGRPPENPRSGGAPEIIDEPLRIDDAAADAHPVCAKLLGDLEAALRAPANWHLRFLPDE